MSKDINNNGYDYVDLGLPYGTLWATCNVGANKPSESGLYFQWGDTQGYTKEQVLGKDKKFAADWSDYKWSPSGDGKTFTKYATDGATLELVDDAAHIHMGGDWHMPRPTQFLELIDNTISEWIEQDGVKGKLFTSKKDKSKSIFIPAVGYAWGGLVFYSGDYGSIWPSMLDRSYVCYGQVLYFSLGDAYLYCDDRCAGLSVRGVIG